MFDSIAVGMSGLQAFSKGLKVIGNNVANLNTPGFKSSDLQFADLYYQGNPGGFSADGRPYQLGTGVGTLATFINFKDGETRQTGNPLDMSVDGNGFFITRDPKDGSTTYTRAGEFEFNKDGVLVTRGTGREVLGYGADASLAAITLNGLRVNAPKRTTEIKLGGNLTTGNTSTPAAEHTVNSVSIIDSVGAQHTVKLVFTPKTGADGTWTVKVVEGTTETAAGEIAFVAGSLPPTANKLTFNYAPAGADPQAVVLDLSDQVTSFAGGPVSTLGVMSTDGTAAGNLTKIAFDEKGVLTLTYSNGKTDTGAEIALATFESNVGLEQIGSGEFSYRDTQRVLISRAGAEGIGSIVSNQIEASNVDLASEFSNLIIMQRGYQASSRIVSTADEMLKELFNMKGGGQ